MKLSKSQNITFFTLLAVIYILAAFMQSQLLLKGDVSWQIKLAKLTLAGGKYVKDYFEINPPLSIYLYMPVVAIEKLFALSAILSLRIYIFALASISVLICYYSVKEIFPSDDKFKSLIFLLSILFVFLIVPLFEFGQREHLLLIFTMPYLLIVVRRMLGKNVSIAYAVVVGLLAGIGFAIKPFFLITFLLVELYFLLSQQSRRKMLFAWIRVETLCISAFLLLYLVFIYVFHKEYLTIVVPIASHFYYATFGQSWQDIVMHRVVFFCCACVIFYVMTYKRNSYEVLTDIFIISLIGYLAAYLFQELPWYYHLLPALSIALILYVIFYFVLTKQLKFCRSDYIYATSLALAIFYYPTQYMINFYLAAASQKTAFNPMIRYLHTNESNRPVYFFSANTAYMVSVIEHAGCYHASRLQFISWMVGYTRTDIPQVKNYQQMKDENFLTSMLVDDLKRQKPDVIFVDRLEPSKEDAINRIAVDYLSLLEKNPQFQTAWKPYHYIMTFEKDPFYKFDVYRRSI